MKPVLKTRKGYLVLFCFLSMIKLNFQVAIDWMTNLSTRVSNSLDLEKDIRGMRLKSLLIVEAINLDRVLLVSGYFSL